MSIIEKDTVVWVNQKYADEAPREFHEEGVQEVVGAKGKVSNVRVYAGGHVEVDVYLDYPRDFLKNDRYNDGRFMECLSPEHLDTSQPAPTFWPRERWGEDDLAVFYENIGLPARFTIECRGYRMDGPIATYLFALVEDGKARASWHATDTAMFLAGLLEQMELPYEVRSKPGDLSS